MNTVTTPPDASRAAARSAVAGRQVVRLLAVLGAIAVLLACWASVASPARAEAAPRSASLIVPLDSGRVQGVATSSGVEFRGVPFAAPPTGELRWKPPQPVAEWSGVRDASTYSPVCPQGPPSPNGQSEDCLYLNVTVPADAKQNAKLPVIVWIHGGGFELGEGADYEASDLAGKGAIVVTINYRLGLLGFLSHPALAAKVGGPSGNYGLMDQQAALQWVNQNIRQFGGDPRNVTIAGQSAGGLSVAMHLASSGSKGLFQRAVIESGSFAPVQKTLSAAESEGQATAEALGCADQSAECLRQLPVETLVSTPHPSITPGVIDGAVLTRSVGDAIATGKFNRVPIINGVNTQEERLFIPLGVTVMKGATVAGPSPIDESNYESTIATAFGVSDATAASIAEAYPPASYASPEHAFTVLNSDANFSCPAIELDAAAAEWVPTFAYEFNDAEAPQLYVPDALGAPYAATHQSELAYLFDQPNAPLQGELSPSQQQLASTMQTAWVTFAGTGSPATDATPWPKFDTEKARVLSLDDPKPDVADGFASNHKCDLWAQVDIFGTH